MISFLPLYPYRESTGTGLLHDGSVLVHHPFFLTFPAFSFCSPEPFFFLIKSDHSKPYIKRTAQEALEFGIVDSVLEKRPKAENDI